MYSVYFSNRYRKLYRKVLRRRDFNLGILNGVIDALMEGEDLDLSYKDHNLKGTLLEFRECHLARDLLLVYRVNKKNNLIVFDYIGTHSGLFGR